MRYKDSAFRRKKHGRNNDYSHYSPANGSQNRTLTTASAMFTLPRAL